MIALFFMVVFLIATLSLRLAHSKYKRDHKKSLEGGTATRAKTKELEAAKFATKIGSFVSLFLFVLILLLSCISKVSEGSAGIPVAFGQAGDSSGPGIKVHAPWTNYEEMNIKLQEITFNCRSNCEENSNQASIPSQAAGGGSLTLDMTVQYQLPFTSASNIYKQLGPGNEYLNVIILPASRECPRDATVNYSPEEAFTTKRTEIADKILNCIQEKGSPYGIIITDVFLREVDPGQTVRNAIDNKVALQQEVQTAGVEVQKRTVELEQTQLEAQAKAIEAFGTSKAEQIISCGGKEIFETDPETGLEVLVDVEPNETCEEQFSPEYLDWLFIQQLPHVPNLTLIAPSLYEQEGSQTDLLIQAN